MYHMIWYIHQPYLSFPGYVIRMLFKFGEIRKRCYINSTQFAIF